MFHTLPTFKFHISPHQPSLQLLTIHHFLRTFYPKIPIQLVPQHHFVGQVPPLQHIIVSKYKIASLRDFAAFLHVLDEWIVEEIVCVLEHLHMNAVHLVKCGELESNDEQQDAATQSTSALLLSMPKRLVSGTANVLTGTFKSFYNRCIVRDSCGVFESRAPEECPLQGLYSESSDTATSSRSFHTLSAHQLECFYATRQVSPLSTYTLRTILKEIQIYVRNRDNFDVSSLTKQLVQCQIYIYIANLVPTSYLNDYPELKQFVEQCYACTKVSEDSTVDPPASVLRSKKRYYSTTETETFEHIVRDDSSSEKLLLAPSPNLSLETSAKYFLGFAVLSTATYFVWRVALPRYQQYMEYRHPKAGGIVIYIPEE